MRLYLDECAAAGVYVLWDSNIDTIAVAGFNGTEGEAWTHLIGNLSLVRDHPAFGGYYACDDCCHMGANRDEHEYRGIEAIRQRIYEWDPFHPFIGSSTCGNIWMWQEGQSARTFQHHSRIPTTQTQALLARDELFVLWLLEYSRIRTITVSRVIAGLPLNPGLGFSDVGLDVVMREHYSSDITDWNTPHWTEPRPPSMGATTEYSTRYSPMTFAPVWDMPGGPDEFADSSTNRYKGFMYAGRGAPFTAFLNCSTLLDL